MSGYQEALSDLATTDSLMGMLEERVAALEAVAAVAWPWRIWAAWKLGAALRRSVAPFPGDTFAHRRVEATTNAWLYQRQEAGEPASRPPRLRILPP